MKEPKDPRSTYRRRARKVLLQEGRPYECTYCHRTPQVEGRVDGIEIEVTDEARHYPGMATLEANHINKIIEDCDPANLEWACKSCHKVADMETEKGVSKMGNEYGY